MADETVTWAEGAGVATITLNRPHVLNALNRPMAEELHGLLRRAAAEESVRAVLLTGAGRAFLAGQDLRVVDDIRAGGSFSQNLADTWNAIVSALWNLEKPVVAAVNGSAVGAGIAVALACDLVLASDRATFVGAFDKLGFIPDAGLTWLLPRLIGMPKAMQTIYLGEPIDAPTAAALGLVAQVVPADELLGCAGDIARRLATGPTAAFGATKRVMHRGLHLCLDEALALEAAVQDVVAATEDAHEGVAAYLDKRPPKFRGR